MILSYNNILLLGILIHKFIDIMLQGSVSNVQSGHFVLQLFNALFAVLQFSIQHVQFLVLLSNLVVQQTYDSAHFFRLGAFVFQARIHVLYLFLLTSKQISEGTDLFQDCFSVSLFLHASIFQEQVPFFHVYAVQGSCYQIHCRPQILQLSQFSRR